MENYTGRQTFFSVHSVSSCFKITVIFYVVRTTILFLCVWIHKFSNFDLHFRVGNGEFILRFQRTLFCWKDWRCVYILFIVMNK